MTITTKTTYDEAEALADAAAKAIARADEARAKADAAAKRAEAERQTALTELRRRRMESFDAAALEADVMAARSRFVDAVQAGEPALLQFTAWQTASTRLYIVSADAEAARQVVAPERQSIPIGGPSELVWADEVQKVLAHVIANKVEDLADEMQAELDQAGR